MKAKKGLGKKKGSGLLQCGHHPFMVSAQGMVFYTDKKAAMRDMVLFRKKGLSPRFFEHADHKNDEPPKGAEITID